MKVSYEEAVKRGWVKPEDVPKQARPTRARKNEAEGEEQAELIDKFREQFPDVGPLLIHIPNGGFRKNAFEGWRLKKQGVRAGVSDLLLPVARGGFFGLWIEFKAAPPNDAPVSESQEEWVRLMQSQGYSAHVCLGAEAAMKVLTSYLALPPTRVSKPRKAA
ncbi:VRR-NUC domain-containing protein [Burkholderia multivorans]|uniref:VRR-NUC domain-containing protein n=1 Tax=Burkholderia multivorans TaxID=87883 RepID=UPI001C23AEFC|nr:VRR-NUC domain-containing protein [Burkholderia multivorans]MBU9200408.1 VRR-NUC domain-containing protein [Burkholderia multivorans]MDN8078467.1 VRR-NUC domain-containing protein [Burkholderia multivorans]